MNRFREILNISLAIIGIIAVGLLMVLLWNNRFDGVLTRLVVSNFPVIIGLPFSFIGRLSWLRFSGRVQIQLNSVGLA